MMVAKLEVRNPKFATRSSDFVERADWHRSSGLLPFFSRIEIRIACILLIGLSAVGWRSQGAPDRAAQVVQAAIDAMGGKAYLEVKNTVSHGRYFVFRDGRQGFSRFFDWTVYEEPVKSRFQLGNGKNAEVHVHNLELNKGWVKESAFDVREISEQEMEQFKETIKRDLDYLLRNRLDEEGMNEFYYGPDEIAGSGELEAVEFIDRSNDSVVVYFDRKTHLPNKVEGHFTDNLGLRHKEETEFYNWHEISGVLSPLRHDTFVDGELSSQMFLEELLINQVIPAEQFLEPEVKERKKKNKR